MTKINLQNKFKMKIKNLMAECPQNKSDVQLLTH